MEKITCYDELIATVLCTTPKTEIAPSNSQDIIMIDMVIATLPIREAAIIRGYFGLDGIKKSSIELGSQFSITRSRIQQLKQKALRKLRHPSRGKAFKRCVKSNRLAVLEEDNKILSEDLYNLRIGLKNIIQQLVPLACQKPNDITEAVSILLEGKKFSNFEMLLIENELKSHLSGEGANDMAELEQDLKIYLEEKEKGEKSIEEIFGGRKS